MRSRRVVLGLALAAASFAPLACSGDDDASKATTADTEAPTADTEATTPDTENPTIVIKDFAFTVVPVSAGTITIKNEDGSEHTVSADDGSFSVTVPPNGVTSFLISAPGTYAFHCNIHASMKGTLVVT